jgi:hypothetical protein
LTGYSQGFEEVFKPLCGQSETLWVIGSGVDVAKFDKVACHLVGLSFKPVVSLLGL